MSQNNKWSGRSTPTTNRTNAAMVTAKQFSTNNGVVLGNYECQQCLNRQLATIAATKRMKKAGLMDNASPRLTSTTSQNRRRHR